MKILVTGGAGYVGTSLIPLLLAKNYEVTVIDRLLFGSHGIIPFFKFRNFHFVKGDIRNDQLLKLHCADKDVIVHLAAIVGYPACREHPDLAYSTNVAGSRVLASLLGTGQHVINASTGSMYGEVVGELCTEETPLRPLSVYGKTKTEAEKILMDTGQCTSYRLATAFGISPRLRLDLLINEFTYHAVKQKYLVVYESHFRRTFIDVADMAASILFWIDHRTEMSGKIYNVGNERLNYSKREVCDMIARETGAYMHYADIGEDQDKRNYEVSYQKIRDLGFVANAPLEEGIRELVRAFSAVQIQHAYSNNI
jgi:nucleoside-diphosphate-sugar epimerase